MASKPQLPGEIVMKYLTKFPKYSKLGLARKIYEENKPLFSSVEAARALVRTYTNANGVKNRRQKGEVSKFVEAFAKLKKEALTKFFVKGKVYTYI